MINNITERLSKEEENKRRLENVEFLEIPSELTDSAETTTNRVNNALEINNAT